MKDVLELRKKIIYFKTNNLIWRKKINIQGKFIIKNVCINTLKFYV